MAESTAPIPLTISRAEQIFPTLSEAQMQRLASHGSPRSLHAGEVLVELGDKDIPVFLVISGELEVVRPSFTQETSIRVIGPGQFTGEVNTLSGRRAFARIRARQDSEVVQIARTSLGHRRSMRPQHRFEPHQCKSRSHGFSSGRLTSC